MAQFRSKWGPGWRCVHTRDVKGEYLPCWFREDAILGRASSGVPAPRTTPLPRKRHPPHGPLSVPCSAYLTPGTAGGGWGGGVKSFMAARGLPSIALVTKLGGRVLRALYWIQAFAKGPRTLLVLPARSPPGPGLGSYKRCQELRVER